MKKLILILLLIPFFITPAYADSPYDQAAEEFGVGILEQGLTEGERNITGPVSIDGAYDTGGALYRILEELISHIKAELKDNLRFISELLTIILLCSLIKIGSEGHQAGLFADICCVCALAGIMVSNIESLVSQITQAMYRLSDYSAAALPVVFTAAAAGGAVSSAGVKYAIACLAMNVLIETSRSLIQQQHS